MDAARFVAAADNRRFALPRARHAEAPGLPAFAPPRTASTLLLVQGCIELVGGILLIIGLFTRAAAFVLSGDMAVAYFMAHVPKSPFPTLSGGDTAILFCFVFFYLIFAGRGPVSLDALRGPTGTAPRQG